MTAPADDGAESVDDAEFVNIPTTKCPCCRREWTGMSTEWAYRCPWCVGIGCTPKEPQ